MIASTSSKVPTDYCFSRPINRWLRLMLYFSESRTFFCVVYSSPSPYNDVSEYYTQIYL